MSEVRRYQQFEYCPNSQAYVGTTIYVLASAYDTLSAELAQSRAREAWLVEALRNIDAYHTELNRLRGRDESRSYTLAVVRKALA